MVRIEVRHIKGDKYEFLKGDITLYPKDKTGFCIIPYCGVGIHLLANGDSPLYGWSPYSVKLTVYDADDFCVEKTYQFSEKNYRGKIHELINWMKDMDEAEINDCGVVYEADFFPEV